MEKIAVTSGPPSQAMPTTWDQGIDAGLVKGFYAYMFLHE